MQEGAPGPPDGPFHTGTLKPFQLKPSGELLCGLASLPASLACAAPDHSPACPTRSHRWSFWHHRTALRQTAESRLTQLKEQDRNKTEQVSCLFMYKYGHIYIECTH